jgi:hypothetical protein
MNTKKFITYFSIVLFILTACTPAQDPEEIVNAWNDALNVGEVETALTFIDENAVITIVPPPEGMNGIFTGLDEIRGWYEGNAALNGYNEIVEIKVDGENISWISNFGMDEWRNLGVDSLKVLGEGKFVDGKFLSYTVTIPPESLAKLPPPPDLLPEENTAEEVASSPDQEQEEKAVDTVASKVEDLVGIWGGRAMGDAGYHKFNQNGTFTVSWNFNDLDSNPSASAEYWFEDAVLHVKDGCGDGTYIVTIHTEGSNPKSMKFELVEDSCEGRINDWKSGMRWVEQ